MSTAKTEVVMNVLRRRPKRGFTTREVADQLNIARTTALHKLRALHDAGLVYETKAIADNVDRSVWVPRNRSIGVDEIVQASSYYTPRRHLVYTVATGTSLGLGDVFSDGMGDPVMSDKGHLEMKPRTAKALMRRLARNGVHAVEVSESGLVVGVNW